jgi:hypothetical protein
MIRVEVAEIKRRGQFEWTVPRFALRGFSRVSRCWMPAVRFMQCYDLARRAFPRGTYRTRDQLPG